MFLYHTKPCLGAHSNEPRIANQQTGFYMMGTLVVERLTIFSERIFLKIFEGVYHIRRSLPHTRSMEKFVRFDSIFFYPHFLLRPEFNNTEHSIETYILLG